MANIRPFRGIRYNLDKIGGLSPVITQPYDRIGPTEQAAYYARHPHSFIRIELGLREPDAPDDNVYSRARCYARTWLAEGVLERERRPALYVLDQTFALPDGRAYTRRGLVAALELTRFDEGVVLPHEQTFSAPKADRLNLTRATATAWSHIFVLYSDSENLVNRLLQPCLDQTPLVVAREQVIEPGVEQRFWRIEDPAVIAAVVEEMAPRHHLIIADGHHRYETALNYREEMRARQPGAPTVAGFNHALVTLVSMSDPSLVILPTHRLIRSYDRPTGADLLHALEPYFAVQPVADRAALDRALAAALPDQPRIGFYDGRYVVLTLRSSDSMDRVAPARHPAWRALDVSILHELVLEQVLNLSKESAGYAEQIAYLRDADSGVMAVERGEGTFLFILNPTRVAQVRACAEAGETMPQKSTDFYPKIVSGLVALPLDGHIAE